MAAALSLTPMSPVSAQAAPVLTLDHGRVIVRQDPFVGPADPSPVRAPRSMAVAPTARAAGPRRTVASVLADLEAAGRIDTATADSYRRIYAEAVASAGRLTGRRRVELRSVLATLDAVAASGNLRAGRLPLAFLTLRRNREWWTTGPLLSYGQRVAFAGSSMVWQAYPGQGIQVQWLATFGKANAFMSGGRRTYDAKLSALLDETTALAAPRAGGIAWESWFHFDGGRPPWVSALGQGTALQAYSRAAAHLYRPSLMDVARSGLGIFRTAAPTGVKAGSGDTERLLIYSFAPRLEVLNAFTQAVNGLHDYAVLSRDPEGDALYRQYEGDLRRAVPRFDTGAWSLYSLAPRESDLGYHTLLRDFLRGMCDRTTTDRERAAARQSGAPLQGDPATGGVAPGQPVAPAADPATLPDPAVYCTTAERFTADLTTPPALKLGTTTPTRPRSHKGLALAYTLSKVSDVTTEVTYGGKIVAGRRARLGHGTLHLRFTPRRPGRYGVRIRAVDLAGNAAQVTGSISVRPRRG